MKKEHLNMLCCPKRLCRGDLKLIEKNSENYLLCVDCGDEYIITDGIPLLYPNARYSPDIHKRHWDQEDKAISYAKKYNSYLNKQGTPWGIYTHTSELRAIDKLIKAVKLNLAGKTVVDCGCGNGRLLSVYPEAKIKIGIDASLILLKEAKKREPDFLFICAQLEDMPLKDCVADLSVSIRVFQHLLVPEDAFSEMARITKPSGFVSLELYNKLNLKELYKRFRMLKFMDKYKPWGMSYDRYYSYREIESWAKESFVKPIKYSGAGWGIHFYLFELIKFRAYAPKWLQKIVYDFFLKLEDWLGLMPPFSKTLEKVCFIGSIQGGGRKKTPFIKKIKNYCIIKRDAKQAKKFEKVLLERNYCYAADDWHHIKLTVDWLKKAQDATPDAGVSRGFSLVRGAKCNDNGWQPSYPETTGYIIPTFIKVGKALNDNDLLRRARLMADWEINIMHADGSVHGGNISESPNAAIFDTGQVIRGLISIYKETRNEKYLSKALEAGQWILKNENEKQGRWIKNNANCVNQDTTTYNIYAIAPLAELGIVLNNNEFVEAGRRAGDYTLKMQKANGWFDGADFNDIKNPLLHTIGYTVDGLWDLGILLKEEKYLTGAKKTMDNIILMMAENGFLPGRINENWKGAVEWACLTGMAQIGVGFMKLYHYYNDDKYLQAAVRIKEFIKSCQNNINNKFGGLGGVWGSWPISGNYGSYQALNWSAKYFVDLLLETASVKNKNN